MSLPEKALLKSKNKTSTPQKQKTEAKAVSLQPVSKSVAKITLAEFERGEFETIEKYKNRISKLAPLRIGSILIGRYNIEKQYFPIENMQIENWAKRFELIGKCFLKLNLDDARILKTQGGDKFDLYAKLECIKKSLSVENYYIQWNGNKYDLVIEKLQLKINLPSVSNHDEFKWAKSICNKFKDNGNGTITDNATGLIWQQKTAGTMNWDDAMKYCKNLKLGSYSDWRLPSIEELLSIVDLNLKKPKIDTAYFPDAKSSFYWSASSYAYNNEAAWGVGFYSGDSHYGYKSAFFCVRALCSRQ